MASSSSTARVHEGVFAIHKPLGISSAQVIRDAQTSFQSSNLFQPWLTREQGRKDAENHNQKRKRKSWKQRQPLQVKMGHGGTLDPMATGVLILGVGSGTKSLDKFLGCTKSYEAVVLFGVETDSYDAVGKLVGRKPYEHVTERRVEEALGRFRGQIMQRPPIFSALKVQGKKLYEYAREGKKVPIEIEERPVEVQSLDMLEWMEGGSHAYHWPEEEAAKEEKELVEKVLHLGGDSKPATPDDETSSPSTKRKREDETANGTVVDAEDRPSSKRIKSSSTPEPMASGAIQDEVVSAIHEVERTAQPDTVTPKEPCLAPACRLRMTVTSGFYVRSLCHDLGIALDSAGLMASLVRSRQGDFELDNEQSEEQPNENQHEMSVGRLPVLDYADLAQGEEVWGPKVHSMLEAWNEKEGLEATGASAEDERIRRPVPPRRESKPAVRAKMRRNTSSAEE